MGELLTRHRRDALQNDFRVSSTHADPVIVAPDPPAATAVDSSGFKIRPIRDEIVPASRASSASPTQADRHHRAGLFSAALERDAP
jgi:hypothetical protein